MKRFALKIQRRVRELKTGNVLVFNGACEVIADSTVSASSFLPSFDSEHMNMEWTIVGAEECIVTPIGRPAEGEKKQTDNGDGKGDVPGDSKNETGQPGGRNSRRKSAKKRK